MGDLWVRRWPLLGGLIGLLLGLVIALVGTNHYVAQISIPVSVAPGVDTQGTDETILSRQVAIAAAEVVRTDFPSSPELRNRLSQEVPGVDKASLESVEVFAYARTNLVTLRVAGRTPDEAVHMAGVAAAALARVLDATRVGPITIKPARFTDLPVRTAPAPTPAKLIGPWGYERPFFPFAGAVLGFGVCWLAQRVGIRQRGMSALRIVLPRREGLRGMVLRAAEVARRPLSRDYLARGAPVFRPHLRDLPKIGAITVLVVAAAGAGGRFISTPSFSGYSVLTAAICLLAALLLVLYRRTVVHLVRRLWWFLAAVVWAGCSIAWSVDPWESTKAWVVFLLLVSAGVLLPWLAESAGGRWSVSGVLLAVLTVLSGASLVLVLALPQWGVITSLVSADGSSRWNVGLYAWNSALGVAAGVAALIAVGGLITAIRSWWLWTALLVNVVTILISRSATSLLALAAGTAVIVMLAWVRMRLVGVITAAVLALMLLVPWQFDVFGLVGRSADLTGRVPIWQTIIAATGAVRLSGLGMGVSPDLEPYLGAVIPHAHNGYIQVVVELGILGLVFFGILLVSTIRGVARRGGSTAVGALVFFLTANVANNYLIAPTLLALLFGWLMGMAIRPHGGPPATAPMRSHRPYRSRRTRPDAH